MANTTKRLIDLWEVKTNDWTFVPPEKDPEVDGKVFLGKVVGQMFVPGGISGNNRFYPEDLWEDVLDDEGLKQRLKDRLVFGMIGHEDKAITEEDLKNGQVSHVVTKLWIDEERRGMGEALIYNTDVGRNLWMYLKGGSKLRPSTRAGGSMVEGLTHEGVPIVDKETYTFETVDFVMCPGFSQVDTKLVEKKIPNLKSKINSDMETNTKIDVNELVKSLTESRDRLQKKVLDEATKTTELSRKQTQLVSENAALRRSLQNKTRVLKELVESSKGAIRDIEEENIRHDRNRRVLEQYKKLGTPKVISSRLKNYKEYKAFFEGLGDPKRAANIIEMLVKELKEYRNMGTPREIDQVAENAMRQLREYRKIGTISEINEFLDLIKSDHKKRVAESKRKENLKKVEEYSRRLSMPVETVRKVVESMPAPKAYSVLKDLSEVKGTSLSETNSTKIKTKKNLSEAFGLTNSCAARNYFRNSMAGSGPTK